MRRLTAAALLLLATPAGAQAEARIRHAGADAQHARWARQCTERADAIRMRPKLKPPFVKQCIAGYRINAGKDAQIKPKKP